MKRKKYYFKPPVILVIVASSVFAIKIFIWDSRDNRWLITDIYYVPEITAKLTIAPPIEKTATGEIVVDDASKLNRTSVNYFKLIMADGVEVKCSSREHPELFGAVIGGMGLFSVITEVNLKITENTTYNYKVIHQPRREMISFMEQQIKRPTMEMIEAQMSVDRSNFLGEAQIYYTDILQEYFVPLAQANNFLDKYVDLLREHNMYLINVTVRKVNQDESALVSYATSNMYAFVSYYKIARDHSDSDRLSQFTQKMMDMLHQMQGTFYLAYKGYYTKEQLHRMYPQLSRLFSLKKKYDPKELFTNSWYKEFK